MISAGLCAHAKRDILMGVHAAGDEYCLALYTTEAMIDALTCERYTSAGEVVAKGYAAGGKVLEGYACEVSGTGAMLGWTVDPVWKNTTIKAAGALIYNRSKDGRALLVIEFDEVTTSTNGNFRVYMPAMTLETAPIVLV